MAAAAKINCHCCGEPVAVNLNRSGRAYYHCGHCGLSVVSKAAESSAALLGQNPKKESHEHTTLPTKTAKPTAANHEIAGVATQAPAAAAKKSAFKTLMDN